MTMVILSKKNFQQKAEKESITFYDTQKKNLQYFNQ